LDEAIASTSGPGGRPFDLIIVGGGSFGATLAQHLVALDTCGVHRILVLEAGFRGYFAEAAEQIGSPKPMTLSSEECTGRCASSRSMACRPAPCPTRSRLPHCRWPRYSATRMCRWTSRSLKLRSPWAGRRGRFPHALQKAVVAAQRHLGGVDLLKDLIQRARRL
jgi:hypothetical protein